MEKSIGNLERGQNPDNAYDRRPERAVWLDVPTPRVTGGLSKYFNIYERLRLRGVITGVGGVVTYDQSGPRTVRMGVRLEW